MYWSMRTMLTAAAAAVFVVIAAAMGYVGVRPPGVFFPDTVVSFRPSDVQPPMAYEEVVITASDQVALSAWWAPAPAANAPVILFLPDEVGDLGDRLAWIRLAVAGGFSVLALDYRGYGDSDGHPSVSGVYRDADAAHRWLGAEKGVEPDRIVILGRSLGASVAAHLAERRDAALLVLESAFTHVADQRHETLVRRGWSVPRLALSAAYWNANLNTVNRVAGIDMPILILHSPDNDTVPFDHARAIAAAGGRNATLSEVRGRHNSVIDATGSAYFVLVRSAYESGRARALMQGEY